MSFGSSNKSISTIGKGYQAPRAGVVTANPNPQAGASTPGVVTPNPNPQPIAQQNGGAGGVTSSSGAAPAQVATAGTPTDTTLGSGSLGQDPAYLAFLRTSGIKGAEDGLTAQSQIDAINNELQRRLPDLRFQGEMAQKQIAGNMESRGILRSGERFMAGADQAHQQAIQEAQLVGTAGDQQAAIRWQNALNQAAIQRGIVEQALNSGGTVYGG